MKFPFSWLKEYLDSPLSESQVSDILTLGGIEVEDIKDGDDPIFEVSLTPNLGHCLSVRGIARDLAALCNGSCKKKNVTPTETSPEKIEGCIQVAIEDKVRCLHYSCRLIKNVTVGPSPDWLKERIEACGLRSINNVVDVMNLVMLDYGQPLHAFDYDTIAGKKIRVTAKAPLPAFTTLDEVERKIPEGTLLICDEEKPLAIAGVIGGLSSAVSEKTKNVLIESALFTPQSVRKASKNLGLKTDSSYRFERGVDPQGIVEALDYATTLVQKVAGGDVVKGAIDKKEISFVPKKLSCRLERVQSLLGIPLSLGEVAEILQRLGMKVRMSQEGLEVEVPSYRNDISSEIDLVEEIARVYGYNNIPPSTPYYRCGSLADAPIFCFEEEMRAGCLSEGLQECITCDLISPTLSALTAEKTLPSQAILSVLHPSSLDQSVLRHSLLPGLLQVVKFNLDRQNHDLSLFEVGRIHFKEADQIKEHSMVGILLSGSRTPYHWDPKPNTVDFFDLKGFVENLLQGCNIRDVSFESSHLHNFHPWRQAKILVNSIFIGVIGELHPQHLEALGIKQRVLFAELNLQDLLPLKKSRTQVSAVAAFPGSERDWTLTVKEEFPLADLLKAVHDVSSQLLERVQLLDLYKSEQIGKDRKNITLRFFYRDKEKTLAIEAVEKEHARLMQKVTAQLGASLIA